MRRRSIAAPTQLALSFDAPPAPAAAAPRPAPAPPPAGPLAAALARHEAIDSALRAGGPNPLPGELTEGEWQYQLWAFRAGGPYECELLQQAETAVELLVEMLPEPGEEDEWADEEPAAPPESARWRIYRESLADLTEEQLDADMLTASYAGRKDTVALIAAELGSRSWAAENPPGQPSTGFQFAR